MRTLSELSVPAASLPAMRTTDGNRHAIAQIVHALDPLDEFERTHQATVNEWIASGSEIYRITSPDTPPMHLVSYFVPFDHTTNSILVAAHRKSGLDLPPGGHCEPGELPWDTVQRECVEELGIPAVPLPAIGHRPLFLTVTETRGTVGRHTDVSLWYVLDLSADQAMRPDPGEFAAVRWLTLDALLAEPITHFDPHMHRFAHKLRAVAGPTR